MDQCSQLIMQWKYISLVVAADSAGRQRSSDYSRKAYILHQCAPGDAVHAAVRHGSHIMKRRPVSIILMDAVYAAVCMKDMSNHRPLFILLIASAAVITSAKASGV